MAYTALGAVHEELCQVLDEIYETELAVSMTSPKKLATSFARRTERMHLSPPTPGFLPALGR